MIEWALANWPLPVVGVLLAVVLCGARELGGLAHRRLNPEAEARAAHAAETGFILTSVIGLLSLLIAFTFNLALTRYEARRALVAAEANAVDTAFQRAQLLDDPARKQVSDLVRAYGRTRLQYGLADEAHKPSLLAASRAQRRVLARTVFEAVRPEPARPAAALLIPAINEIAMRGVDREAALSARIPDRVMLLLLWYAVAAAATLGYALESTRGRHRVATGMLFLLLAVTIATMLDLDRPRSGLIVISQEPMRQVLDEIG